MFAEKLSSRATRDLQKLGVHVRTNTAVREIKSRQIIIKDGEPIPAEVTVWAAGVKGEPTASTLNLPLAGSRVKSTQTLQVENYPHIWAVGDISGALAPDGRFYPMVAPVAMQQGRFVAEQIINLAAGKPLKEFKYKDKGSMATIGRHKAVVEV
jgi:NADH dehydrogenase